MLLNDADTFFPELGGDERRLADEWLEDYLRIVIRICRERREAQEDDDPLQSS